MNIGKSIRVLCAQNDVMSNELASAIGVSVQTVSYWVNGKSNPSISRIEEMAKFFKIRVSEIIEAGEGR